jgi:hypothetical protein
MSLRKEGLLRLQTDNSSPESSIRQKGGGIEYNACCLNHLYGLFLYGLFPDTVLPEIHRRTYSYYWFGTERKNPADSFTCRVA